MRIQKTSLKTPTGAHIVDGYSTSTTDGYSCNEVNNLVQDVYSTNEVKTNKVWIDNKPIYKLSFLVPSFSNSAINIQTGVTTIDTLVDMKGSFYRAGNALNINYFSLPNMYLDEFGIKKSTGVFSVKTTIADVTFTGNVTIYYTKITD